VFSLVTLLAQAAQPAQPEAAPSGIGGLLASPLPLIAVMFAIFYFMIIRPQQKQRKTHEGFLTGLQKGDEVITNGGILGKVAAVQDSVLTLEVASNVKVRVLKSHIAGPFQPKPEEGAKPAEEKK